LAHVVRGYVHHIEQGRRWPSAGAVKALDAAPGADGVLLAAWELGARARRLVQRHHDIVVPLTLAWVLVHAGRPDKAAAHGQAV
jgi:hypothetical protein